MYLFNFTTNKILVNTEPLLYARPSLVHFTSINSFYPYINTTGTYYFQIVVEIVFKNAYVSHFTNEEIEV